MKYIQIKSDWVPTFIGTPEDVIEHLKEYYLSEWALKDFGHNKEQLNISVISMSKKKFEELGEWEG